MKNKLPSVGVLLVIAAAVLWALDGILRRDLYSLPPLVIVFYEHLFGTVLILPFVLNLLKTKLTKKVIGLTLLVALLSGLLGTLWFTSALVKVQFIPFSVVFLLQKLQPIFAISAAAVWLKEKVTHNYLWYAALAMVAAYFVTFPDGVVNLSTGTGTLMAALLAVGAAFAWGTSTVFSKLLLKEVDHTTATALRFSATTVLCVFALVFVGQDANTLMLTTPQVGRLLFIAVSTGMVALWIYYRGLRLVQAKVSTLLELVFPLLAVFIDAVMYKMVLAPSQYLAAVVLMAVVYRVGLLQQKTVQEAAE